MTVVTPPPGRELLARGAETMSRIVDQARTLADVATRQAAQLAPATLPPTPPPLPADPAALWAAAGDYAVDAAQRGIL